MSDASADRAPWGPGGHGGVGQGHLTQVNFLGIRELDQSLASIDCSIGQALLKMLMSYPRSQPGIRDVTDLTLPGREHFRNIKISVQAEVFMAKKNKPP